MAEADDLMPPGLTRTAESWLYVTPESEALDAEVVDEEDMAGPGLMEADDDPPAHLMGTDAVPDPYDDPDAAQWRPIQDVTIPDEIKPEPDPAPAATPPASRDDLLAVVEVLASRAGKTAAQYTARAVLGLRRNVEDWTAEELADFIAAQAPDLELAELLGA
jgi:hypothetical protein